MHSAKRGFAIACRLSVRLTVCDSSAFLCLSVSGESKAELLRSGVAAGGRTGRTCVHKINRLGIMYKDVLGWMSKMSNLSPLNVFFLTKTCFRPGIRPGHTVELTTLPNPLVGWKGEHRRLDHRLPNTNSSPCLCLCVQNIKDCERPFADRRHLRFYHSSSTLFLHTSSWISINNNLYITLFIYSLAYL